MGNLTRSEAEAVFAVIHDSLAKGELSDLPLIKSECESARAKLSEYFHRNTALELTTGNDIIRVFLGDWFPELADAGAEMNGADMVDRLSEAYESVGGKVVDYDESEGSKMSISMVDLSLLNQQRMSLALIEDRYEGKTGEHITGLINLLDEVSDRLDEFGSIELQVKS